MQSVCGALPGERTREVLLLQKLPAALASRELLLRLLLGRGSRFGWSRLRPAASWPRAFGRVAARLWLGWPLRRGTRLLLC